MSTVQKIFENYGIYLRGGKDDIMCESFSHREMEFSSQKDDPCYFYLNIIKNMLFEYSIVFACNCICFRNALKTLTFNKICIYILLIAD